MRSPGYALKKDILTSTFRLLSDNLCLPRCFVEVPQESKCLCLSVSLQGIWVERSGAARGDPDVTTPVPISAVQRCCLPTAPLLWRQQDQS